MHHSSMMEWKVDPIQCLLWNHFISKMPLKQKLIKLHKFQAVMGKVIFVISAFSCRNLPLVMRADTSAA